jgi:hypothetical protein
VSDDLYQPHTGSSLDTNRHESNPITDGPFHKTALMATEAALRKVDARASVVLLTLIEAFAGPAHSFRHFVHHDRKDT